jgi:hypothetical protein
MANSYSVIGDWRSTSEIGMARRALRNRTDGALDQFPALATFSAFFLSPSTSTRLGYRLSAIGYCSFG